MLSDEQIIRYSRHILLPEVGGKGQQKLLSAKVLLIGAGGLGSPVALYLAAAGVGTLGIMDADTVDLSNLQRQIIHATPDVGKPKVQSVKETISCINPDVNVIAYPEFATVDNIPKILPEYDLVVDGCDNFATRYLMSDAAVIYKKPYVYGSIFRFDGQASVFNPPQSSCYRCIFPEAPPAGAVPSCQEAGVIGVLPGLVGLIQATEALKLILGIGEPLLGRLLLVDALDMEFRSAEVKRNTKCPACGDKPTITDLVAENYRLDTCSMKMSEE